MTNQRDKIDYFIKWSLTPSDSRLPDERTKTDLTEKLNVSFPTLNNWERTPYFEKEYKRLAKRNVFPRIEKVKNVVYETALKGDMQAAKLFKEWEAMVNAKLDINVEGEVKATVTLKDMIKAAENESDK